MSPEISNLLTLSVLKYILNFLGTSNKCLSNLNFYQLLFIFSPYFYNILRKLQAFPVTARAKRGLSVIILRVFFQLGACLWWSSFTFLATPKKFRMFFHGLVKFGLDQIYGPLEKIQARCTCIFCTSLPSCRH